MMLIDMKNDIVIKLTTEPH